MLSKQVAVAALIAGASSVAHAYDIGKLTCQNVGQLAAHMLMARQSGVPPEAYLSALNQQLPPDANVERKLAADIAQVVYQSDEIGALQPQQAFAIFAQNCAEGQEQDRMSGQRDEATPDEDTNQLDEDDEPDAEN
jgi:hypothetical protein